MNTVLKRTLLSTLIVPFAFGVQSASADMISTWDYFADSSLSNWNASSGNPADIDASNTDADTDIDKLSWGNVTSQYPEQSSISISDKTGSVNTGEWEDGGVFTHNNRVIDVNDPALTSFDLNSTLFLTPTDPASETTEASSTTFRSFFSETPNQPAGSCVSASSGVPCDDIFTIGNAAGLGGTPVTVAGVDGYEFTDSFTVNDYTYTVFLQLLGVRDLAADACSVAGAGTACVGFLTQEEQDNTMPTRFKITGVQNVPEPGTLALLGLSLAGLGLSRRKKAAKA